MLCLGHRACEMTRINNTIPEGFQVFGKAPAQVSSEAYMTYVSSEASGQHSQNLKDNGYKQDIECLDATAGHLFSLSYTDKTHD